MATAAALKEISPYDLTWNQKGQLTHVAGAAVGPIEYRYDAMGRRVSKIVNGVTTKYLYDGLNLIAELDGDNSNAPIAWYVYAGLDRPLARVDATDGSVLYYHQDLLGSVIALTDEGGNVATQYNYSPFGHTEVIGTDIDQPFRFTGREWDAETGLYFYRARYYSPHMRRFISEDPLRFAAGDVNFYAYVGSNPVNFTDPLGLYGYGVHFPLTRQWAHDAGFSWKSAFTIAYADKALDEGATRPIPVVGMPRLHFLSPAKALKSVKKAINSCSLTRFGQALHMYQDTFSHWKKGFRWDPWKLKVGHIFAGVSLDMDKFRNFKWPDEYNPSVDSDDRDVTRLTMQYLKEFLSKFK